MRRVSIYMPSYNCGQYIEQSVRSALNQTFEDYDLVIIDDGSTDDTSERLEQFKSHPKVRMIRHGKNMGFVRTAAETIPQTSGEYIMRLDADDYLDENALMVMVNILDKNPDVGMVYSDYFQVNQHGDITSYFRKAGLADGLGIMDLPANGAGTMIRRSCYEAVGGYRTDIRCQDKYDLWIKFLNKFKPYAVGLPLYFYRRHDANISNKTALILKTRRYIKRKFIGHTAKRRGLKVLGIIPSRARYSFCPGFPMKSLAGKPVVSYAVSAMKACPLVDRRVFVTEDAKLAARVSKMGMETILRPPELAQSTKAIEATIQYVLEELKRTKQYVPDIVVVLFVTSPLVTSEHIEEAIDTMLIFNADTVISAREDRKFHYLHGADGLQPLFKKRLLKFEKELLFEETGSLIVTRRDAVTSGSVHGKRVGHILLTPDEAIDIESGFEFWMAEQVLRNAKAVHKLE